MNLRDTLSGWAVFVMIAVCANATAAVSILALAILPLRQWPELGESALFSLGVGWAGVAISVSALYFTLRETRRRHHAVHRD